MEDILQAETIYVVGIRSCAPLASFLGFYLNQIFGNVKLVTTNSASEVFEQMIRISKKDVIIGISFPRYSMRTLKGYGVCQQPERQSNHPDGQCAFSHESVFILQSGSQKRHGLHCGFTDSSFKRHQRPHSGSLHETAGGSHGDLDPLMEKIWDEYQVYSSDEINYLDNQVKLNLSQPKQEESHE